MAMSQRDHNDRQPIHRLPSEIIISILLFAVPSEAWCRRNNGMETCRSYESDVKQLKSLMEVCWYWRTVIDSAPYFWTVMMQMDGEAASSHKLRKSAGLPLDIYADDYDSIGEGWKIGEFISSMGQERHRWRTIEIVAREEDVNSLVELLEQGAPMLEAIWLENAGYRHQSPFTPPKLPKLTLMNLERVDLRITPRMPCVSLERLRLSTITIPTQQVLADILQGCPNLLLLDLVDIECPATYSHVKGGPITLERLEFLRLSIPDLDDGQRTGDLEFFPTLHTPSLRKLCFDCDPGQRGSSGDMANVMTGFPDALGVPTIPEAPIPSVLRNTVAKSVAVGFTEKTLAYQLFTSSESTDAPREPIIDSIQNTHDLMMEPAIHYCADVQPMAFPSDLPVEMIVELLHSPSTYENRFRLALRNFPGTTDIYGSYGDLRINSTHLLRMLESPSMCPKLRAIHLGRDEDGIYGWQTYRDILDQLEQVRPYRGTSVPMLGVYVLGSDGDDHEYDLEDLPSYPTSPEWTLIGR